MFNMLFPYKEAYEAEMKLNKSLMKDNESLLKLNEDILRNSKESNEFNSELIETLNRYKKQNSDLLELLKDYRRVNDRLTLKSNEPNLTYEEQYNLALMNISSFGYADGTNERTGHSTRRLPCITFRVDLEKEFPILTKKQVYWKTAMREILWIWQKMSNNINDLNAKIWNEWADENGSIGKAYGYQMRQPVTINEGNINNPIIRHYDTQTNFILEYLKEFPNGRRAKTTLWNVSELGEMNLCPCVHSTDWNLDGGRLNLVLTQRSGDMPYGVPFDTTQYAMLQCMFARHLGVKPGILLHVIADAHIYDNQLEGVEEYLDRDFKTNKKPKFVIDDGVTSFWDMNETNCKVIDYIHGGKAEFGEIVV